MEVYLLSLFSTNKSMISPDPLTFLIRDCSVTSYGPIHNQQANYGDNQKEESAMYLARRSSFRSWGKINSIWYAEHTRWSRMGMSFSPKSNWWPSFLLPTIVDNSTIVEPWWKSTVTCFALSRCWDPKKKWPSEAALAHPWNASEWSQLLPRHYIYDKK